MTDFHSHILPGVDDGSKSIEESLLMLELLSNQGINRVVATPHFYANDESVEEFLERRQKAFDLISESSTVIPQVVQGAEVKFYDGISRLKDLKSLCIQGTNLLLLEMPFNKWTEYTVRELIDISSDGRVTVVLAHFDRYLSFQKSDVWYRILDSGILLQMNADYINNFFSRQKALSFFKKGAVHFIGSDCHNMNNRVPEIGKAIDILEKKLGNQYMLSFDNYVNEFFEIKI